MSQTGDASAPTETPASNIEVSAFADALITVMDLRRFETALDDGSRLCVGLASSPGEIFSLEIGYKKGSSYSPIANLSYRNRSGVYRLAAASHLPKQLRRLRGLLSPNSSSTINYEQALFAAYELLTYLKRHG